MKPTFRFGFSRKTGIAVERPTRPSISVLKSFSRKPRFRTGKPTKGDGLTNHQRHLANKR